MGIGLGILGGLIALVAFISGAAVSPQSAPQQAVQELRFVEAILGITVLALGCILYRIENLQNVSLGAPSPTSPDTASAATEGTAGSDEGESQPRSIPSGFGFVGRSRLQLGDRVFSKKYGVGAVQGPGRDRYFVRVVFDERPGTATEVEAFGLYH